MTREPPPSFETPATVVTIPCRVSTVMAEKLAERARALGYKPAHYATMLLEAAWAARCGNDDDPALREAVVQAEGRSKQ